MVKMMNAATARKNALMTKIHFAITEMNCVGQRVGQMNEWVDKAVERGNLEVIIGEQDILSELTLKETLQEDDLKTVVLCLLALEYDVTFSENDSDTLWKIAY